jgi:oxygen-independent coproporphyrinogen III oxidase
VASIYIHIPFCEHKCIYCDFFSVAPEDPRDGHRTLIDRFLPALEKEIQIRAEDPRFQESYDSIYFGGGTPSLLSPSEIEKILDLISSKFSVAQNAEISLEANPGTVDKDKLRAFRSAGINRISIGVQSFDDEDLKFLTRIHNSTGAKACLREALSAGFENVSIDLIFSLPGQTAAKWKSNLEQAVDIQPAHISCYSLIIEPETPLFRMIQSNQVAPVDSDTDAGFYELAISFLTSNGYEQYEVSNFAKTDAGCARSNKCRHNLNYWDHTNYLGFGPSAHSFWKNERWWNISDIAAYIDKSSRHVIPLSGGEHLTQEQLLEEAVFLGLRSGGIDLDGLKREFRYDLMKDYGETILALIKKGYAQTEDNRFRLTPKGFMICDEICQMLH